MQHLLERIKAGTLWDFHGGIHPPENKHQSSLTPVVDAGLPPQLIIPVRQHAGPAGELLVRVGDKVKKGQPLTRFDKGRIVPVHASTSGTITAIEQHTVAHPSGLDDLCILLTPDGDDAWGERTPQPDYWNLERGALLERIQQAGIAGLGGAVFPTHSKLDGRGQLTEILIINGLECEPYITTDDRLMQEYADEIMDGIRVLKHLLKPKLTLIGVEDNKPAAIEALTRHASDADVLVKSVPTKYPSGGAKQTIELLTGRQVPKGGRAVDMGIMVLNVATVFAIKRAIIDGEPLIERIVTLTGDAFKKPGNAWVRLGTPVRWLLQRFELQPEADQRVIMGGPMMGFTLPHAMVPVVKATNCLLSPTRAELPPPARNRPASVAVPAPMPAPPPCCPRSFTGTAGSRSTTRPRSSTSLTVSSAAPVPGSARAKSPWCSTTRSPRMTSARPVPRPRRPNVPSSASRPSRLASSVRRRPAKPATPRPQPSVARP
ncbi:hypothetical protein KAM345_016250 [Aeromonas caviae]|nr:hypothetical protein KAM345_016250 [Aeromonas caviae]